MNAYLELARPGNAAMASFSAFLAMLVVMGPDIADTDMLSPILLGMLVPFFVTAGGNSLNDYMDHLVDIDAHPERPLPSGRISNIQVILLSMACFVIGLVLAATIVTMTDIGLLPVLIAVLAVTLLFCYEVAFKYRGLPGNLVVAVLSALTFVFGASVVAEPDHEAWAVILILFTLAFFASAGREVTKDVQDIDADRGSRVTVTKDVQDIDADRGSRVTLPMTAGIGLATGVALIFIVAAVAMSPFPYWPVEGMGLPYLAVIIIADVVFLYSLPLLKKEPGRAQRLHKR
jgi:geranylgeranylglycerol-phosphate geranylgeranyltransferase